MLTVGPGSKASRTKLLRICDHHTSMYLQMRAPRPTVKSCGKCILHTRKSSTYATPPVPTSMERFIVSDARPSMQIPTSVDRCAQKESLSITKTRMLSRSIDQTMYRGSRAVLASVTCRTDPTRLSFPATEHVQARPVVSVDQLFFHQWNQSK